MSGYNGWTNYETWNVALHFVDSFDGETSKVSAEDVEYAVDEYVRDYTKSGSPFIGDIIQSFMGSVDWQEIADAINTNNDIQDEDEDEDKIDRCDCEQPDCNECTDRRIIQDAE